MAKSKNDLRAALDRARKVREDLGSEADELNARFLELEKALRQLGLGVSASVLIKDADPYTPPNDRWETLLTFHKDDGKWSLVVQTWDGMDPESGGEQHITAASLETRKLAVDELENLVVALCEKADEQVEELRRAAERVATVTAAVREK